MKMNRLALTPRKKRPPGISRISVVSFVSRTLLLRQVTICFHCAGRFVEASKALVSEPVEARRVMRHCE